MWKEGKTLIIITGASRGYGQEIAVQMAQKVAEPSFVLISRALNDLKNTEKLCQEKNSKCQIKLVQLDLQKAKKEDFEIPFDFKDFDSLVLVHNAGSLGNQGTKVTEFDNEKEMADYFYLNVISVMILNSKVAKESEKIKNKLVINITSLAALQPFETWGSYCSGKAARDSLFKCMAVEESDWKVLNWAPGPMETKMIEDLLADDKTHPNIRKAFEGMKGNFVACDKSVEKMIQVLDEDKFKSGDHVDFFD